MKMILDLDTGIDDALAIAYALGLPGVELIGVTKMCIRDRGHRAEQALHTGRRAGLFPLADAVRPDAAAAQKCVFHKINEIKQHPGLQPRPVQQRHENRFLAPFDPLCRKNRPPRRFAFQPFSRSGLPFISCGAKRHSPGLAPQGLSFPWPGPACLPERVKMCIRDR